MKKKLIFLILFGILVILSILTIIPSNENQQVDGDVQNTDLPKKKYKYQLISNLTWQVYSLPERSVIKARSFRIEKRRFGGFSLGGFNQLIIDNLKITIPYSEADSEVKHTSQAQYNFQIKKSKIRSAGEEIIKELPSFSALRINYLDINANLSDGLMTNVLSAVSARLKGGRILELDNCNFLSDEGIFYDNKTIKLDLDSFLILYKGKKYNLFGL